jgi:hypothetical protein
MPFDFKLKTSKGRERGPMGFLNAGPTFSDFVSGKTAEEQRTLFMPVAHIIGRMHALGVEHGHVTMNNVHMYGSKLCLTDFSMAEQKRVDWNSTNSIYYAFIRDYSTRILRIGSVLDIQFCKEFFRRIVSNYPTSKKIKQELIELLDSDLRAHECTSFLPYSGPC